MDPVVFHERLAICRVCPSWRGACVQGHPLQGLAGCPERRFAPLDGAGYFEPSPVKTYTNNSTASPCGGCGGGAGIQPVETPLTWTQAMAQFAQAMVRASEAGWPLLDGKDYNDRLVICRACDRYRHFQCLECLCVVMAKARLATEDCPKRRWPAVHG